MFAVLKTGGKQYKVASGDVLRVEKLDASAGETIQFNEVLMVNNDRVVKNLGAQRFIDLRGGHPRGSFDRRLRRFRGRFRRRPC